MVEGWPSRNIVRATAGGVQFLRDAQIPGIDPIERREDRFLNLTPFPFWAIGRFRPGRDRGVDRFGGVLVETLVAAGECQQGFERSLRVCLVESSILPLLAWTVLNCDPRRGPDDPVLVAQVGPGTLDSVGMIADMQ